MGVYLNPGNNGFKEVIRSEIYVDKTGLIAYINKSLSTKEKYICVSRPRRFGKSMALEMLNAYYSRGCDSWDLFRGFVIERDESFQEHLNRYDVIYLNMQRFLIRARDREVTEYLEQAVLEEVREAISGFSEGSAEGSGVCCSCVHDGDTFRQKIRIPFCAEHVCGILHDRPESAGRVYRIYREGSERAV